MNYFPDAAVNEALYESITGFEPQMPMSRELVRTSTIIKGEIVPPGALYLEDGGLYLSMYAPKAEKVEVNLHHQVHKMQRNENGIWEVTLYGEKPGFCPVFFFVDGVRTLNSLAPIGYGACKPMNYVEIPNPEADFYHCKQVPHGAVVREYYYSATTKMTKSCLVYTPPGYMKGSETYPVLYLQHGHGENENTWIAQGKAHFIMDNLIAEGKAAPCILVMNNGMVQFDDNGERKADMDLMEEVLLNDCIPYIEANYRVKTDKWNRGMAGLSMGSLQTTSITLRHPELFGYVGLFAGFMQKSNVLHLNLEYLKALDDKNSFENNYRVFFRGCGDVDDVGLTRFHEDSQLMKDKGLAPEECSIHTETYYSGEHEWNVWRECFRDFMPMIFK